MAAAVVLARVAALALGEVKPAWPIVVWIALSMLIVGGTYAWASLRCPRRVVLLASVLAGVHPLLLSPTPDGVLCLAWLIVLWGSWAGHRSKGVRFGLAVAAGMCVAPYLFLRQAGPMTEVGVWRFWELAPGEASLRTVLVNYLSRGGLYGVALVGAWFAVRGDWRAWLVPMILVALTWAASAIDPALFTASAVAPILCVLASIGFWQIYEGLGRTSGHGILAIEPVKERRAPVGPNTAADA